MIEDKLKIFYKTKTPQLSMKYNSTGNPKTVHLPKN